MPERSLDDIAYDIIFRLDTFARDTDEYAFGLPVVADDNEGVMLQIVKDGILEYYNSINHMKTENQGMSYPNPERELTYGEKAVGLTFNPSNTPEVDLIKRTCANAIDVIHDLRVIEKMKDDSSGEKVAQYTLAIRALQDGQMWGVKGFTWRD